MALHSLRNNGAIFHERAKDLGVAWTCKEHEGPALIFSLDTWGRDDAMDIGLENPSTEDGERVPNITDGMPRERLCSDICTSARRNATFHGGWVP